MSGVRLTRGKVTDCFGENEREGVLVQELQEGCDSDGFPNGTYRWRTACPLQDAAEFVALCPPKIYRASTKLTAMRDRGAELTLEDELEALL